MSLVGTLAKMAIGVAVAKGIGSAMNTRGGAPGTRTGSTTGGLFGTGGTSGGMGSGGGLQDMMGSILGGGTRARTDAGPFGTTQAGTGGMSGGLGGLLEGLGGGSRTGGGGGIGDLIASVSRQGGLGGLLGGMGGQRGGGSGGGGLGGLLGGLLGGGMAAGMGGAAASAPRNDRSFGEVFDASLRNGGEPDVVPTPEQDVAAALMLRAMIQAAKADGTIDAAEKQKLLGNLGDVSQEEMDFVQAELDAPLDVAGLVAQIPKGLERQVYTMSVLAIDLDHQKEADYLNTLAKALSLTPAEVNEIHAELGVPALYA